MDMPEHGAETLAELLERLVDIRSKLERANETLGYTTRVNAMKQEILQLGWDGILARYHPDVNIDDPAACPLFELYRLVYNTMEK
jgi:hypothetical protein